MRELHFLNVNSIQQPHINANFSRTAPINVAAAFFAEVVSERELRGFPGAHGRFVDRLRIRGESKKILIGEAERSISGLNYYFILTHQTHMLWIAVTSHQWQLQAIGWRASSEGC